MSYSQYSQNQISLLRRYLLKKSLMDFNPSEIETFFNFVVENFNRPNLRLNNYFNLKEFTFDNLDHNHEKLSVFLFDNLEFFKIVYQRPRSIQKHNFVQLTDDGLALFFDLTSHILNMCKTQCQSTTIVINDNKNIYFQCDGNIPNYHFFLSYLFSIAVYDNTTKTSLKDQLSVFLNKGDYIENIRKKLDLDWEKIIKENEELE